MPTNRARRTRKPDGLTPLEKQLLLTGETVPPRGSWEDQGESVLRTFMLVWPAGRRGLRALWERHRADLLSEWARLGKCGRPWAARKCDDAPSPPRLHAERRA